MLFMIIGIILSVVAIILLVVLLGTPLNPDNVEPRDILDIEILSIGYMNNRIKYKYYDDIYYFDVLKEGRKLKFSNLLKNETSIQINDERYRTILNRAASVYKIAERQRGVYKIKTRS